MTSGLPAPGFLRSSGSLSMFCDRLTFRTALGWEERIALNPGRPKEVIPTVNFYPTAEMWLGPHFWQYAKCTKEEALAADFFLEKRDTPHYLYLKCWPEPFTRPDGEQGRMQQRLWKLFFHEDCEWPPGSGTICEDPMFGPPELMPKGGRDVSNRLLQSQTIHLIQGCCRANFTDSAFSI